MTVRKRSLEASAAVTSHSPSSSVLDIIRTT